MLIQFIELGRIWLTGGNDGAVVNTHAQLPVGVQCKNCTPN
jgi:hypothetical protein